MADRIAIMRDGIIEQVGTPHEVFAKPANVFVASFIGTPQMNLMEADLKSVDKGMASVKLAGKLLKWPPILRCRSSSPPRSRSASGPAPSRRKAVPARSTIGAQAELIEPMGAETLVHARTKWVPISASSCRATRGSRSAKCCI